MRKIRKLVNNADVVFYGLNIITFSLLFISFAGVQHDCHHGIICLESCHFPTFAMVVLLAIGLLYASFCAVRSLWKVRSFLRKLHFSDNEIFPSRSVDIPEIEVQIFRDEKIKWAFTAGVFRPKIYLSTALRKSIDDDELYAVLLHEVYHCKKFHTLKTLIVNFIGNLFFFVPPIRLLRRHFQLAREKSADHYASINGNNPLDIVSALVKLAKMRLQPEQNFIGVVGTGELQNRIETVIGKTAIESTKFPTFQLFVFCAIASFMAMPLVACGQFLICHYP